MGILGGQQSNRYHGYSRKNGFAVFGFSKRVFPNKFSLVIKIEDSELGAVAQVKLFEYLAQIISHGTLA